MRTAIKLYGRFHDAKEPGEGFVTIPISSINYVIHMHNDKQACVVLNSMAMFIATTSVNEESLDNDAELDALICDA